MIFITSSISNQITQLFIKEHIFYTRHLFDGFFMYAIHEKSNTFCSSCKSIHSVWKNFYNLKSLSFTVKARCKTAHAKKSSYMMLVASL